MSNERIDLTQVESYLEAVGREPDGTFIYGLIAELKRCYEEIDYLNALTNNLPVEMLVEAENKLYASE